ncbi:MAG: N-acetylglucosamine kinase [Planctomycetota bacterium]|jgi:N-acetylglucosamine kinase-like BadF-type ATPase
MVNSPQERLVIGVDAGGSKTKACLAIYRPDDPSRSPEPSKTACWTDAIRVIGNGETGPGNPRSVGFDTVYENVKDAIGASFQSAGIQPATAHAICVCMAGVGQADQRIPVAQWIEKSNLAHRVRVSEDVTPIRWAALWETRHLYNPSLLVESKQLWNNSVTLISGTGSIVSATKEPTLAESGVIALTKSTLAQTDPQPLVEIPLQTTRVGGWGYLLGDEGSGFAIGLSALKEVCRAHDCGEDFSPLHRAVLRELGCECAIDLIPRIYTQPIPRPKIASLYQTVVQFASSDLIASKLLEYASADLAELIVAGATRIGLQSGKYGLAFSGGTLLGKSPLVPTILRHLEQMQMSPALSHQVTDPVLGAVVMACLLQANPKSRVD